MCGVSRCDVASVPEAHNGFVLLKECVELAARDQPLGIVQVKVLTASSEAARTFTCPEQMSVRSFVKDLQERGAADGDVTSAMLVQHDGCEEDVTGRIMSDVLHLCSHSVVLRLL